jgi:hypothetical protein
MFCSLGVPFLTMGDERWRTQRGNNNAYCQDNDPPLHQAGLNASFPRERMVSHLHADRLDARSEQERSD